MAGAAFVDGSKTGKALVRVEKSWREYRTYSEPQALAADFLTNQGVFALQPSRMPHLLYGGAAWGGKSYFIRSVAFELCMVLRELGFPNQFGAIYCDTLPNLTDRHIVKFKEEFAGIGTVTDTQDRGLHVRWHGEGMGGVYLRHVVNAGGKSSRRGFETAFALPDELTELLRDDWAGIMYNCRSGIKSFPFSARGHATNPDGIGHGWVKSLFVPKYRDLEDRYIKQIGVKNFLYVPALLTDNPAFEEQGDVVSANIAAIEDDDVREARLNGTWDLYSSGRFHMWKDELNTFEWPELLNEYGLPDSLTIERMIRDPGEFGFELAAALDYATSPDSCSAYGWDLIGPDERVWSIGELHPNMKRFTGMQGLEAEDQADLILLREKDFRLGFRYADPKIMGKESSRDDKSVHERFLDKGVYFLSGNNNRVQGAGTVASMIRSRVMDDGKIIYPKWRLLKPRPDGWGCPCTIKMIPSLPRAKNNPEDVDPQGGKNHWYDRARYLLHSRFGGGNLPKEQIQDGSLAYYRALVKGQKRRDSAVWRS